MDTSLKIQFENVTRSLFKPIRDHEIVLDCTKLNPLKTIIDLRKYIPMKAKETLNIINSKMTLTNSCNIVFYEYCSVY